MSRRETALSWGGVTSASPDRRRGGVHVMAAAEKNDDPIEAMISSRPPRRAPEAVMPPNPGEPSARQPLADETASPETPKPEAREAQVPPLRPPKTSALEARLEVRPIGT